MNQHVLSVIMGGGKGVRMYPLTKYRSKPAVPLGAKYRLIDVPISNCLNSGFNKILVLTQYNSESLNKHISRTYKLDSFSDGFVEVLAASQSYDRTEWFQGTADSVRQSLAHMNDPVVDQVAVLSGDQLYTMDLRKLQAFHNEKKAQITVACHPVPVEDVHRFGIMDMDASNKIESFHEKPQDPSLIKQKPVMVKGKKHYLANMGIYFFEKDILTQILQESDKDDFGKEIIPEALQKHRVYAYTFNDYWCDVGTIKSYFEANIALSHRKVAFNLYDEDWRIYTHARNLPPAKVFGCRIDRAIIAEGGILDHVDVKHSVIGVRCLVGRGTILEEVLLAGNDYYEAGEGVPALGIGEGCEIRRAMIDKNVRIGNRVKIINAKNVEEADGEGYSIRDGVVVVHKNAVIPDGTVI